MSNSTPTRAALALGTLSLIAVLGLTGATRAFPRAYAPAGEVPFEFQAGQVARASEVNQNFAALAALVGDLQAQIDGLESRLAVVEETTQFLTVSLDEINGLAGPHLILEGANLHVRSGSGATDDFGNPTGLGNLVIGYDEEADNQVPGERAGAHNLVLGRKNRFTSTGGIVAGERNTISGSFASVLAGANNTASGDGSCVSGGSANQACGEESAIAGGGSNVASALRATVGGGVQNTASGVVASISGGAGGTASGFGAAISGGSNGSATGFHASISGGLSGLASGSQASVTGGASNAATGTNASVSGGLGKTSSNTFEWRACNLTCP